MMELVFAFLAGLLTLLNPCVLPILPGFLAYLTGMNSQELLSPGEVATPV